MATLGALLSLLLAYGSTSGPFCSGYDAGYEAGYCNGDPYCVAPPAPPCPPDPGNTYGEGYARGFREGSAAR
jgi:hypothetical protein